MPAFGQRKVHLENVPLVVCVRKVCETEAASVETHPESSLEIGAEPQRKSVGRILRDFYLIVHRGVFLQVGERKHSHRIIGWSKVYGTCAGVVMLRRNDCAGLIPKTLILGGHIHEYFTEVGESKRGFGAEQGVVALALSVASRDEPGIAEYIRVSFEHIDGLDHIYNHQNEMCRRLKRNAYFDTETKCGIYLTQHIRKALNYCSNRN